MSEAAVAAVIVNPFSTRFTRPGRLPPLDAAGRQLDIDTLLRALRTGGGDAAIVGPHGTGKTTLLLALAGRLAAVGGLAGLIRLHSPGDVPLLLRGLLGAAHGSTLCVDGWERLGLWGMALRMLARWRGCRLVVTSHRAPGLPILVRSEGNLPVLLALVARLPDHGGLIDKADIVAAHRRHGGNLRESLYELYDRFQCRCR
ncbi:MAG: hypothetical protein EBR23_09035 [Planctomycetia bacterium]|nr:hypothetical protein [Planctomycetia bacterium]